MSIKICVVGLGYVGLPLACLLSKKFPVIGFDINEKKINDLKNGFDETGEVEELKSFNIGFSADPKIINEANFIIIAVPTPIDKNYLPDLSPLQSASKIVGKHLQKGSLISYESTVYPGCTEEECLPILEKESGLKLGVDFKLAYSPERINPGDKEHYIDTVVKIVSGSDQEALDLASRVYGSMTTIHQAPSIKVAEAAKVIENVQRSLNIALMNELALIFDKMGINTKEVIEAAGTKWNFHKYKPGLVGGHCIGIDPYYLTYKAQQLGYEPKVILAGQEVNEQMSALVASKLQGRKKVLVMGVTFKENVPDIRNTKALDMMNHLEKSGSEVYWYDPVYCSKQSPDSFSDKYQYLDDIRSQKDFDGIIVFSPHLIFEKITLEDLKSIANEGSLIFDIKGFYDKKLATEQGFVYLTL